MQMRQIPPAEGRVDRVGQLLERMTRTNREDPARVTALIVGDALQHPLNLQPRPRHPSKPTKRGSVTASWSDDDPRRGAGQVIQLSISRARRISVTVRVARWTRARAAVGGQSVRWASCW